LRGNQREDEREKKRSVAEREKSQVGEVSKDRCGKGQIDGKKEVQKNKRTRIGVKKRKGYLRGWAEALGGRRGGSKYRQVL